MKTKGIILAGGAGSRLYPITKIYSKQLVAIYDKPMIYYPLSTLIMAGINEILIISNEQTLPWYRELFGDGSHIGLKIEYALQDQPKGIAEAFIIGEDFIGDDNVVLILGDNIFYGYLEFLRKSINENTDATVFGYYVTDPERYGVVEFDNNMKAVSLEEKPKVPKSNYAVPGLYIYNSEVVDIAKNITPSARGELEITDVNKVYLERNKLKVRPLGRGIAWLDSGTPDSLLEASSFIAAVEKRQGLKIGCIEEAAYNKGFINDEQMQEVINNLPNCYYRDYLKTVVLDKK